MSEPQHPNTPEQEPRCTECGQPLAVVIDADEFEATRRDPRVKRFLQDADALYGPANTPEQEDQQMDAREVEAIERAHLAVADRLLASRGSVYQAFRNTACGLDPDALALWWQESLAAQSMGDQSGKAFGCALSVAMMAVEADRKLRRQGRWWVFR